MRFESPLLRILFIVYCVEAGIVFLWMPWTPAWDRWVLHAPLGDLRALALHAATRGALTGFGLLHLVWGLHDLMQWLRPGEARMSGQEP